MASTLGTIQPFRYRGYVYDVETGLYYLGSRYYNPVWKRFINADVAKYESNLYCYCANRVLVYADYNGKSGVLTIFAHHDHAWIAYKPDGEETITYGTWGHPNLFGLHENVEKDRVKQGGYIGRVSVSVHISDEQESSLKEFIQKNNDWGLLNNCASFAARAWVAAGQEALNYKSLFFIPTPIALMRSIRKIENYQVDAPIEIEADYDDINQVDGSSSDPSADSSSNSCGDSSFIFSLIN